MSDHLLRLARIVESIASGDGPHWPTEDVRQLIRDLERQFIWGHRGQAMTREDVPQDVHDVLWTAYRDAGGNMDAGAVELAREVVRLRAKLQTARDGIAKIIMHTGRLPNASPDFLAALVGDDA